MGDVIELRAGGYRALVDRRGAALRALTWQGEDLVWPYDDGGPQAFQGQLLAPWPNRVAEGRYAFGGQEHRLDINEPELGTAIHGLVYDLPWLPREICSDTAVLVVHLDGAPGYPFGLELRADYRLAAEEGLTVTVTARNSGGSAAPYGVGAHPYLTVGAPLEQVRLELPAASRLPVDSRLIPAGAPTPVAGTEHDFRRERPIGATLFDTAMTGLERNGDGRAWSVLRGPGRSVGLWSGPGYDWLQVFSADVLTGDDRRAHLAVEPMSCPPNAFASGEGLLVLEPGQSTEHSFGVQAL